MSVVYKPPYRPINYNNRTKIFLGGSIEMGKAINWQKQVEDELSEFDVIIFNPRRDDWDSSWEQNINNDQFRNQVNWELKHLEDCDMILMYLSPDTISPISLMEIGLYARTGKLVVCCPDEFYRKGNVDIVCTKYDIPLYSDFKGFMGHVKFILELWK